jgi:hypothetical protein
VSEPIRYAFRLCEDDDAIYLGPKEQADGQWVLYTDYTRLKAEVERLTKAGDWVMSHWSSGDGSDEVRFCQALLKWKNAKEGKQP